MKTGKTAKENLYDIFDFTLINSRESHPARLWEIICWQNNIDEDDERIGEIYDDWYEKNLSK